MSKKTNRFDNNSQSFNGGIPPMSNFPWERETKPLLTSTGLACGLVVLAIVFSFVLV